MRAVLGPLSCNQWVGVYSRAAYCKARRMQSRRRFILALTELGWSRLHVCQAVFVSPSPCMFLDSVRWCVGLARL